MNTKQKILSFCQSKTGTVVILVMLFITAVLFIGLVSVADVYGPIHFNDEVDYWNMALDLYEGTYSPVIQYGYPPFYSISILPAFYFFPPLTRYAAVKWLHAIYIASTIFPAYLLLRKFTSRGISLVGVLVLMVSPVTLVIPRCVISENTFYPLLMWTVLLAFTNITPEKSKARTLENILFGIILTLLMLTRYIALALVPGLLLIWWLKPFEDTKTLLMISSRKILHLAVVLLPIGLIMGYWIAYGISDGVAFKELIGLSIASQFNPAQLGRRRLLMWAVFYFSYTLLIAGPYLSVLLPALFHFRRKEWQKDENRWWIALAIIVICFLIPCIRHSWRAAYNYPDPIKLQGRYIMYFGPLFLVSAFGYIHKFVEKIKLPKKILLLVLSAGLIVFGYAILYEGIIYLDGGQLGPAVNAPYGSIIHTMKFSYLIAVLISVVVITCLLGRKTKYALITLTVFLIGLYVYGSVRVYQRVLTSRQLLNAQIHNLIPLMEPLSADVQSGSQTPILLEVPSSSTARYARSWQQTLNFKGYTTNIVELNESLDVMTDLIFQATIDGQTYQLIELDEETYTLSGFSEFTHSGKYYQYVPVTEN